MNRLSHETSPYLRQHANNPVDWYPWGEEALRRSRDLLMQVNARVSGVLLNAVDLSSPDYYYYYEYQGKYGQRYYQEDEPGDDEDSVSRATSSGA